jgi:Ion channel
MIAAYEVAFGLLIVLGVLWDGFATIVLPRTVAPLRRLSGRFNRASWRFWSTLACRISSRELRLNFLSVYGPLSVMLLLTFWAVLLIVGFALIYQGLGPRFQVVNGTIGFGTLLYMSGSTFLTLGLGDVTSSDPVGRMFVLFEAGTGYIFLAMIITYMPLLDQAYGTREVGSVLIHARAGRPPGAIQLLRRYSGTDRAEILRSNLREGERWIAEILQSHLSHPTLSFYRAQHWGESWLVSLMTLLDSSALLIAGSEGLVSAQARLTYRMGLRLLKDLTHALGIKVDPSSPGRVHEETLPALMAAAEASGLALSFGPGGSEELLRLIRRYDAHLVALASWLVIPLPPWIPPGLATHELDGLDDLDGG